MTVGKIENAALQTQQTKDEIKFIRGIGRQSVPATKGVPRAELLRGYLVGCLNRERWDGIDRARVMAFAEAELAEVGAGGTATEGHNVRSTTR